MDVNRSFLGQSFVVSSNDSSVLVTSIGDHGSGRSGDRGDDRHGDRDDGRGGGRGGGRGDRGNGRGPSQRCNYCDMNGHTEEYCWDKWGKCEYARQVYAENV